MATGKGQHTSITQADRRRVPAGMSHAGRCRECTGIRIGRVRREAEAAVIGVPRTVGIAAYHEQTAVWQEYVAGTEKIFRKGNDTRHDLSRCRVPDAAFQGIVSFRRSRKEQYVACMRSEE